MEAVQDDSSSYSNVTMSNEEFGRYQMFQQFEAPQIMSSSSSTATLAQTGNATACFTSSAPSTWLIDFRGSDHMTGNKGT